MNLERVLNGIARYLDREIYAGMNNWQEAIARIAVSRMLNNKSLENMINNPYMRTFAIIDAEGNVDVDGLYRDLRTYISNKGKIEIELPIFGKFTFTESDVDSLYNCIIGG
jgi:hypothetical protein